MDWLLRDTTNELGEHQTLFDSYIEHMAALRDKLQKHCAKHNGRYKSMCVAWVVAAGWLFGRLSHRGRSATPSHGIGRRKRRLAVTGAKRSAARQLGTRQARCTRVYGRETRIAPCTDERLPIPVLRSLNRALAWKAIAQTQVHLTSAVVQRAQQRLYDAGPDAAQHDIHAEKHAQRGLDIAKHHLSKASTCVSSSNAAVVRNRSHAASAYVGAACVQTATVQTVS